MKYINFITWLALILLSIIIVAFDEGIDLNTRDGLMTLVFMLLLISQVDYSGSLKSIFLRIANIPYFCFFGACIYVSYLSKKLHL